MRIEFNRTRKERKELVTALAGILDTGSKYLGAPTMAYEVGAFTITKDGALEFDEYDFPAGIDQILQDLERSGIEPTRTEEQAAETETETQAEGTGLNIEMPRGFYTDEALENLRKIIDSKANLIKKAIGAEELPIEVTDEKVSFPWFTAEGADEAKAYGDFISKISIMAKEAKRVVAKEKDVESEKYAFRCFLLRLGFKGNEYKADRKILLRNLDGLAAFPTKAAADKFSAEQKAKREVAEQ